MVDGNKFEFQQMVINLCQNAFQASSENGRVKIEIQLVDIASAVVLMQGELQTSRYVKLTVADKGAGVRRSSLPHIFEPFYTTRSGEGGTGLGLAVVLGVVTSMRGAIDVASELGEGTTFDLYFPAADHGPQLHAGVPGVATLKGRGEVVAIIHDRVEQIAMYEESVAALGYEPYGFRSAESFFRWSARTRRAVDAVIIDVDQDAAEAFITVPPLPSVPMILVSDHAVASDLPVECLVIARLTRPIKPSELASALSVAISSQP
jgi:hypothetical protein